MLWCCALFVCMCARAPGVNVPPQPAARAAQPPLVQLIEDEAADRGRVALGNIVRRRVTFKNLTQDTLSARVIAISCPCTKAVLGAAELPPGSSTSLVLTTTAVSVATTQWYTADVEFSAQQPGQALPVRQRVQVPIGFIPDVQATMMPTLATMHSTEGKAGTFELHIRRLDSQGLTVSKVEPPGDWVSVRSVKPLRRDPRQQVITLEAAAVPPGFYRGFLKVFIEGGDEAGLSSDLSLRVDPRLIADPAGFVMVTGEKREPAPCRVLLTSRPGMPLPEMPLDARVEPTARGWTTTISDGPLPGQWWLTLTQATHPAVIPSGDADVVVIDAKGNAIQRIPLIVISDQSLVPP